MHHNEVSMLASNEKTITEIYLRKMKEIDRKSSKRERRRSYKLKKRKEVNMNSEQKKVEKTMTISEQLNEREEKSRAELMSGFSFLSACEREGEFFSKHDELHKQREIMMRQHEEHVVRKIQASVDRISKKEGRAISCSVK